MAADVAEDEGAGIPNEESGNQSLDAHGFVQQCQALAIVARTNFHDVEAKQICLSCFVQRCTITNRQSEWSMCGIVSLSELVYINNVVLAVRLVVFAAAVACSEFWHTQGMFKVQSRNIQNSEFNIQYKHCFFLTLSHLRYAMDERMDSYMGMGSLERTFRRLEMAQLQWLWWLSEPQSLWPLWICSRTDRHKTQAACWASAQITEQAATESTEETSFWQEGCKDQNWWQGEEGDKERKDSKSRCIIAKQLSFTSRMSSTSSAWWFDGKWSDFTEGIATNSRTQSLWSTCLTWWIAFLIFPSAVWKQLLTLIRQKRLEQSRWGWCTNILQRLSNDMQYFLTQTLFTRSKAYLQGRKLNCKVEKFQPCN